MKIRYVIFSICYLITLQMHAMRHDNPNDRIVRVRCAPKLGGFNVDPYIAIGHTPIYLYVSCMEIAESNEKACKADSNLKESYDCNEFAMQTARQRCQALYKKALDVVTHCIQAPDAQEKELEDLKKDKRCCASSCNDMQKRCYFSDDFLLSSRSILGDENRKRHCGLFNYLDCRFRCSNDYSRKVRDIKDEWRDEKIKIEEAQVWNELAKQKYNLKV